MDSVPECWNSATRKRFAWLDRPRADDNYSAPENRERAPLRSIRRCPACAFH